MLTELVDLNLSHIVTELVDLGYESLTYSDELMDLRSESLTYND